jgi:hypothetical protein
VLYIRFLFAITDYIGFAGGLSKPYGFEPVESRAQANTVCSIPLYFVEIAQDGEV